MRYPMLMLLVMSLAACDAAPLVTGNVAAYDPQARAAAVPPSCATSNDFGCAVNGNFALQLDNPADLARGHGKASPDTEITTHVIEQYRAGDLPVALAPLQSTTGTSQ